MAERLHAKVLQNANSDKFPMIFQFLDGMPVKSDAIVLPYGIDPTHHQSSPWLC